MLLVPIFVLIGFDALTCTMVIYLATQIGFATSWMNPFSVSISQGIAELPILSGSLFRIIMWPLYIYIIDKYLRSLLCVKNTKETTIITKYIYDNFYRNSDEHSLSLEQTQKICIYSWLILASLIVTIVWSVYGVVKLGYYIPEIVTPFTILGLLTGLFAVIGKVNGMH